jgi:hypothetical protein
MRHKDGVAPAMSEGLRRNPSNTAEWADDMGRTWYRLGGKRPLLDAKRVRALVASDDALMAVWQAFEVEWFERPDDKRDALHRVRERARREDDLRYTAWHSEAAKRLLLVEYFC